MNATDRAIIERWLVELVTADVVPSDEGNAEGLIYNLIRLLRDGPSYEHYDYKPEQDQYLVELFHSYGSNECDWLIEEKGK